MSRTIRFRTTETDGKRLEDAAQADGADLSDFIRDASLKEAKKVLKRRK